MRAYSHRLRPGGHCPTRTVLTRLALVYQALYRSTNFALGVGAPGGDPETGWSAATAVYAALVGLADMVDLGLLPPCLPMPSMQVIDVADYGVPISSVAIASSTKASYSAVPGVAW
jgi:hypothetical protein